MRRPSSVLKSSNRKLVLAFLLLCVSALCLYRLSDLPFIRARIANESDPAVFQARRLPGFIEQAPGSAGLIAFRRHTVSLAVEGGDDFSRAIAIQHWVRKQESDRQFYRQPGQKTGPEIDKTENPEEYLQQQRRGIRSACRRFSYILTGALLSHGIDARVVSISNILDRSTPLAHNVVEVWIPELNKWVVFDPTFDAVALVNGNPASALEVYRAAFFSPIAASLSPNMVHHTAARRWMSIGSTSGICFMRARTLSSTAIVMACSAGSRLTLFTTSDRKPSPTLRP